MTTDITVRLRLEGTDLCIEAAKEIDFLRADNERLLGRSSHQVDRDAAREIRRLRAELQEATQAVFVDGTLARPTEDEPSRYAHNIPPTAPPHDEQP